MKTIPAVYHLLDFIGIYAVFIALLYLSEWKGVSLVLFSITLLVSYFGTIRLTNKK